LWEIVDPQEEAFVGILLFVLICGNLLTPNRCKDKAFFIKTLKNQCKTSFEQKYLGIFASITSYF